MSNTSKSAPITITSEELRAQVEQRIGRPVSDDVWKRSESYARMKLDHCREREPEITYYDDYYLALLTYDTVLETEYSDFTIADCERKMAARAAEVNP